MKLLNFTIALFVMFFFRKKRHRKRERAGVGKKCYLWDITSKQAQRLNNMIINVRVWRREKVYNKKCKRNIPQTWICWQPCTGNNNARNIRDLKKIWIHLCEERVCSQVHGMLGDVKVSCDWSKKFLGSIHWDGNFLRLRIAIDLQLSYLGCRGS